MGPHLVMEEFQLLGRYPAQRDAALIADYDHGQASPIHAGDCLDRSREPFKLRPVADVSALGQLAVQNAIAIKKDVAHYNQQG
jgi:hypothetical protein